MIREVSETAQSKVTLDPIVPVALVQTNPVRLSTSDGVGLHGLWRTRADAIGTAVLAHGFSASHKDRAICDLASDLVGFGLNVLSYDARGHGSSEGACGVGSTEHLDVACAVEEAAAAGAPVVLIGVSMGAVAVVNYLASDAPGARAVAGAVLVSSPARWRMRVSLLGILTAGLTRTGAGRWLAANRMGVRVQRGWKVGETPESAVQRVAVPLAIVHGAGDRLLAVVHGRQLHASTPGPSRLEVVDGMGHGIDQHCRRAALKCIGWILETTSAPVAACAATGS